MKDLKELESLEKIRLQEIPKIAENCDILIYFGECWLSQGIQYFTDSPISHIGMYIDFYGIPSVMESDKDVHLIPLEKSIKQGGRIFLARNADLTQEQKLKIITSGAFKFCDEYDWDSVTQLAVNSTLPVAVFDHVEDEKYYCSEYFEYMYEKAGVKFKRDDNGYSLPRFIALDKKVSAICEVVL